MVGWDEYQEEVAAFFRSVGLDAQTNVRLRGARTSHNIDVVVKWRAVGLDITWLIECKHWNKRVDQGHVSTFINNVSDLGVDRGIILCEKGFQSGAIDVTRKTNVWAMTLKNLREKAASEIVVLQLREVYDRLEFCRTHLWKVERQEAIALLRNGEGAKTRPACGDSLEYCRDVVGLALRGVYPFKSQSIGALLDWTRDQNFDTPREVMEFVTPMLTSLEQRVADVLSRTDVSQVSRAK